MELKPQFSAFLSQIRPTEAQKESWKTGSKTLRDRLAADPTLSKIVIATFLQGSLRRSTAVRPLGDKRPDVDVVVVTNLDHANTTPVDAMNLFVPFLQKHYPDKWQPQGRSFGIELYSVDLDLVITALPADPKSRDVMERLYRSQSVLTTSSLEDVADWRLNEAWSPKSASPFTSFEEASVGDAPTSEWRPHPLFLPDREVGDWGRTHPLAQIQWTAAKNRACNRLYVDLVRAVKWWRLTNAETLPKYPKGYPLEHMVGSVLPDGVSSMAAGMVSVFEGMRDEWEYMASLGQKPRLADHGVPEHDVLKRLEVKDFRAFIKAASEASDTAREALQSTDAQESASLWQALLGKRFPLPGPQGGDRPRSFTEPTGPAAPALTGRFA